MKIVFFGPSLTRSHSDRRSRILFTLLEGVVDRGHHVVYVEPKSEGQATKFHFLEVQRYGDWAAERDVLEKECEDANAICLVSGFAGGHAAVEWLLELPVSARAYYDLDPWETLSALDSEGAAPWIRGDQISAFDIVYSIAGGPATEPYKARWGADEAVTLYEAIDAAIFHPRSPSDDLASDLLMLADRSAPAEAAFETFLLEAARAVPERRFLVAGEGWDNFESWPDNVELAAGGGPEFRATLYSSARLALVPPSPQPIDNALPIDLLEATACGAACAVVDRPGLAAVFNVGEQILVPTSAADLVAVLRGNEDQRLQRLGNLAEKRVVLEYTKLRAATKFEQRLARKVYRGSAGATDNGYNR